MFTYRYKLIDFSFLYKTGYLEFPNGVCTTDKEEILISDNRAHSIKVCFFDIFGQNTEIFHSFLAQVFNYEGQFLRQIGGEGITNYPIGVGINQKGEVVVADNHNNFNLTIFSQVNNPIINLNPLLQIFIFLGWQFVERL
jgi:hypothetical protein